MSASGENTNGGEVKENLVDGDVSTKWLVFASTGWVQFKLSEPVKVVHYAMSSANDAMERDPVDWTLSGSNDGTTFTAVAGMRACSSVTSGTSSGSRLRKKSRYCTFIAGPTWT